MLETVVLSGIVCIARVDSVGRRKVPNGVQI